MSPRGGGVDPRGGAVVPRLGLRENLGAFSLLVLVNAFVGAMVGLERAILPPLAEQEFGLAARTAALSFIVAFGLAKAGTNLLAGRLSERLGRKPVLLLGWLLAAPVPLLLIHAPSWGWVVAANLLLGLSQGLTWSTTVIMKIDLAGPKQRGLAMGLNEFAGYLAVAGSAFLTGLIAAEHGLRPAPFLLGLVYVLLGGGLSLVFVRETRGHALAEAQQRAPRSPTDPAAAAPTLGAAFRRVSWQDRQLSTLSQAGLVNNLNDGLAWGLFPLLWLASGLDLAQVGLLAALYPASWGLLQLVTGPLSDRIGRKGLIAGGMFVQALGIGVVALGAGMAGAAGGSLLLGLGTAMVYPTLLAAMADATAPTWRASAVGVYRFWRDLGYALGALLAGLLADALGMPAALLSGAALTAGSGLLVALRLRETVGRQVEQRGQVLDDPVGLALPALGRVPADQHADAAGRPPGAQVVDPVADHHDLRRRQGEGAQQGEQPIGGGLGRRLVAAEDVRVGEELPQPGRP